MINGKGSHEEKLVDPASPPYEAYVIDYDLFHILFIGISPWGQGCHADELSARLFRVNLFSSANAFSIFCNYNTYNYIILCDFHFIFMNNWKHSDLEILNC